MHLDKNKLTLHRLVCDLLCTAGWTFPTLAHTRLPQPLSLQPRGISSMTLAFIRHTLMNPVVDQALFWVPRMEQRIKRSFALKASFFLLPDNRPLQYFCIIYEDAGTTLHMYLCTHVVSTAIG